MENHRFVIAVAFIIGMWVKKALQMQCFLYLVLLFKIQNGGRVHVESVFVGVAVILDLVVCPCDVAGVGNVGVAPAHAPWLGGGKGIGIEELVVPHDDVLGREEREGRARGAVHHVVFHKDVADDVAVGGIEVGGVLVNTCHHRKACGVTSCGVAARHRVAANDHVFHADTDVPAIPTRHGGQYQRGIGEVVDGVVFN